MKNSNLNTVLSSIVVPNLKLELLDFFLETNLHFFDFKISELIIVSSALNNQSIWQYRQKYPQVRFIVIKKNRGFAHTVNIGFRVATGKYIGTVNDDLILSRNWLQKLIQLIKQDKIGSVNPIILNLAQKQKISHIKKNLKSYQDALYKFTTDKQTNKLKIESVGIKILPQGKAEPMINIPQNKSAKVDATNGACVLYKKSVLQKIGLFDEKFGSYLEDIDLSLRIKKTGYKNLVLNDVCVLHLKHATSKKLKGYKSYLDFKNWFLVVLKNWGIIKIVKFLPQILMERGRNFFGMVKANKAFFIRLSVFVILLSLFMFSRLYKLKTSLLFFNDIGRDFLTLLDWQRSGKPPLLGPQTSALPYNQSAIYFYLLYPLFLLTNHSSFSTVSTLLMFYISIFSFMFIYLHKNLVLQKSLLISLFLITIHPQFISQNRFVWNPSFLTPLILLSFYSFIKLKQKFTKINLGIFIGSITLAVSLSYSVAPLFIAFMILSLAYFRHKLAFIRIYLFSLIGILFWNIPTVFFEFRHHFLLTNLLIHGEKLQQLAISFNQKLSDTLRFVLPRLSEHNALIFLGLLFIFGLINMMFKKYKKTQNLMIVIALLFLTLLITFIVPISIQAHYIFAIITLIFLIIGLLDIKLSILFILFLSYLWINKPTLIGFYIQASRSVAQTKQCAIDFCKAHKEPIFVSVQAGNHPYHNGMEFRYMFKNYGCDVKNLDTEIDQAREMAVVVDNSEYVQGKTKYNELTQFGDSKELSRFFCTDKLRVVVLKKGRK